MAAPKWCNLCNRNIIPTKKFNWIIFLLLFFFTWVLWPFYLLYYWIKLPKCPICKSDSFGPAKASKMGKE